MRLHFHAVSWNSYKLQPKKEQHRTNGNKKIVQENQTRLRDTLFSAGKQPKTIPFDSVRDSRRGKCNVWLRSVKQANINNALTLITKKHPFMLHEQGMVKPCSTEAEAARLQQRLDLQVKSFLIEKFKVYILLNRQKQ